MLTATASRRRRGARLLAIVLILAGLMAAWLVRPAPAAAAAAVRPWPLLNEGDRGFDVRTAQFLLRHHGYVIAADGIFGPRTRNMLLRYQSDSGLLADGVIGQQTWSALVVEAGRGTPPGDLIKALQVQLVSNMEGDLVIDGIFGPKTEAATLSAERHIGGQVNGILSELEWQDLISRRPD